MTDHNELEQLVQDAVAVVECETMFEGLRFPSGDLLTIALEKPRKAFAVVRRVGEQIDVMSLHSDRSSAVNRAQEVVSLIKEEIDLDAEDRGQKPGGRQQ